MTNLDRAGEFYTQILEVELTRNSDMPGIDILMFPMDMEALGATGALILGERSP